MKTIKSILLAVIMLGAVNTYAQTSQASPEKSTIKWLGKKVTGQHTGTVKLKDGQLTQDKGKVTGTFNIDMTTIVDEDLTDATYNGKLIGHLKSEDFFNVEKFPTATFKITSAVEKKGANDNNYEIIGDLTIKGITKPITFPAHLVLSPAGFIAKATLNVNRTLYDIKYGSKSFFASIGDKAIEDNIAFDLYVVSK